MVITARTTSAATRTGAWAIPGHELLSERVVYGDRWDERDEHGLEMRAILVAGLMAIPLWGLLAVGVSFLVGMV